MNEKVQNLSHMKKLGHNNWTILYADRVVKKEIPKIPYNRKKRIQDTIYQKLSRKPDIFGESLQNTLHPYRKLRVGNFRVIYRLTKEKQVIVCAIGHRSTVYEKFLKHH
jgi:mRNA interferase RelE/StbE